MLAKIEPFEFLPHMILYMEIWGWSRCAVVSQNGINIKVFKCSMKNARGKIKNWNNRVMKCLILKIVKMIVTLTMMY